MSDIVYVDNEPEGFLSQANPGQKARIRPFTYHEDSVPEEAFPAAQAASLWLLDFYLIDQATNANANLENGLSLLQKWRAVVAAGRPTTVVVSNHLEKVLRLPPGPIERRHVLAQRLGVEWVDEKTPEAIGRIIELADASKEIASSLAALGPSNEENGKAFDIEYLCFDVLRASKSERWAQNAQRQVDRARPPRMLSSISEHGAARPIISWLISHVLPYPSFLLTDAQAALRLGVQPSSFISAVADKGNGLFRTLRYGGPLSALYGRRWWRAAVDDLAWELGQGEADYREALSARAGTTFQWLDQAEPVLVSSSNLVETNEVADASECVRVTDEDFPADIDPAWVRISQASEDRQLSAKVVYEDRELLSASE